MDEMEYAQRLQALEQEYAERFHQASLQIAGVRQAAGLDVVDMRPLQRLRRIFNPLVYAAAGLFFSISSATFLVSHDVPSTVSTMIRNAELEQIVATYDTSFSRIETQVQGLQTNVNDMGKIADKVIDDVTLHDAFKNKLSSAQANISTILGISEENAPRMREESSNILNILDFSLIGRAEAATNSGSSSKNIFERVGIRICFAIALSVLLFGCFFPLYTFSKDRSKIKFAETMIKTITGFWLGLAAGSNLSL